MNNPRWPKLALAVFLAIPAGAQAPIKVGPPLRLSDLEPATKACTDFYQFASGGWLASNPVPAAFSTWGSFNELTERNNLVLRDVLDAAAKAVPTTRDANTRKLGTFYASCMDSAGAETAGAKPLAAELSRISAISNRAQLNATIAHQHAVGMSPLFSFGSDQDARNSSLVIVSVNQGGISLPNRDYYTKTDAGSEKIRAAHVDNISKTFVLLGETPEEAQAAAAKVMAI